MYLIFTKHFKFRVKARCRVVYKDMKKVGEKGIHINIYVQLYKLHIGIDILTPNDEYVL